MIKEYPDVFTNDYMATQPWDKFNIELLPGAKPFRQRVRPLAPPLSKIHLYRIYLQKSLPKLDMI